MEKNDLLLCTETIMYRISALNTRGLESKNAGFLVGYHLREVNIQGRSQLQFFFLELIQCMMW